MSEEILEQKPPSRKSELENLILVLLYLINYSLQWSVFLSSLDSHKLSKMKEKRKEIVIDNLFLDLPSEFKFIYDSIKSLTFYSKPNYDLFRNKLLKIIENNGGKIDQDFCFKKSIIESIEDLKYGNYQGKSYNKMKKLFSGYPIFN